MASQRGTSVYLIQKVLAISLALLDSNRINIVHVEVAFNNSQNFFLQVIPMLPQRLCEDLCSLNPHQVITINNY